MQGLAARRGGGCQPETAGRLGEHHRPRRTEGTRPGRVSGAGNEETPAGSGHRVVAGKPEVTKAEVPGGRILPKKRMPAAERRQEPPGSVTGSSSWSPGHNWPDTGPGALAPKGALTWAGEPVKLTRRQEPEPKGTLNADDHGSGSGCGPARGERTGRRSERGRDQLADLGRTYGDCCGGSSRRHRAVAG